MIKFRTLTMIQVTKLQIVVEFCYLHTNDNFFSPLVYRYPLCSGVMSCFMTVPQVVLFTIFIWLCKFS